MELTLAANQDYFFIQPFLSLQEEEKNEEILKQNVLNTLRDIQAENEGTELSRRRNVRRYAQFYQEYKKMMDMANMQQKAFGETNATKAKMVNILYF